MRGFFRSRAERPEAVARLERRLGHRFENFELLGTALTHRSYANEQELEDNYERLEFLGDAVLALVAAEWLYRREPDAAEGELSKLKGFLVSEPVLAAWGEEIGLGDLIRLGVGEERSGGRAKPSLLADVLEAVIGAMYLDGGLPPVRAFVEGLLVQGHGDRPEWRYRDAKSALQERLQAAGRSLPRYVLAASEGPDHEKLFKIECWVEGETLGVGEGRSKKHAEQAAAESALRGLEAHEG